jgi:hypothetical protein
MDNEYPLVQPETVVLPTIKEEYVVSIGDVMPFNIILHVSPLKLLIYFDEIWVLHLRVFISSLYIPYFMRHVHMNCIPFYCNSTMN